MILYQILERTPFSIQYYPLEPYQPIAEFQLQRAEYDLKLNVAHYYENAVKTKDDVLVYPPAVARLIICYWMKKYPFADYQIKETEVA